MTTTRTFTIYKIENQQNGRVYIGSTEKGTRRIKQHINELSRGKHPSKALQSDFENGDTFRAISLFAFTATITGDRYYIADTAHAVEKYYIKAYKADMQGYNGKYYLYLYTQWDDSDAPENAKAHLLRRVKEEELKDFCTLYPTPDNNKVIYKPIDLIFSKRDKPHPRKSAGSKTIAASAKKAEAETIAAEYTAQKKRRYNGVTMIKHREINILRAAQGIKTDAELARRLNLTPANFQSLLTKKSGLAQTDLIRIAEACGVRYVSAFIDENGNTIAGGICDPAELDEIDKKPTGAAAHKSRKQPPTPQPAEHPADSPKE